jgi:DNA-directed RNA polymerase specialized sigma24 family protein
LAVGDEKERLNDPAPGDLGRGDRPEDDTPQEAQAPAFEIPAILQLDDPRAIMRRLMEEDPFELCSRCVQCARQRALILNPRRLVVETMARIAVKAHDYEGSESVAEWVQRIVDNCVEELLDEQREEERRGLPVADSPDAEFYAGLAEVFECPAYDSRLACVTLNGMSDAHRGAFHAVIVQGMPLEEWAQACGSSKKRVRDLLQEVGIEVQARLVKRSRARRRRRK